MSAMPQPEPGVRLAVTAIVMAGGRSRRMGRPKAWLEFDRQPLLRLLVERLMPVFAEVLVVAGSERDLPATGARRVDDDCADAGPLAGLVAGLREMSQPLAFVTSCDTPFLNLDLAARLSEAARDCDAAIPVWAGRLQPLQAVYAASAYPLAAQHLAVGKLRLRDLCDRLRVHRLPEDQVRRIVPDGLTFLNVNTPEDYARALAHWPAP